MVRMTSSKRVTSPRTTGAPIGTLPNAGAPGFTSMPTTVSPRASSFRMRRGPMKPVAPMTRIDIGLRALELDVFQRGRPRVRIDGQQHRVGDARSDRARPDVLPDRSKPHPLVDELLDLVEHGLALVAIRLPGLALEEVVDVG